MSGIPDATNGHPAGQATAAEPVVRAGHRVAPPLARTPSIL
ncbi:hypothetical protein [Streptomyces sp. NPDC086182]